MCKEYIPIVKNILRAICLQVDYLIEFDYSLEKTYIQTESKIFDYIDGENRFFLEEFFNELSELQDITLTEQMPLCDKIYCFAQMLIQEGKEKLRSLELCQYINYTVQYLSDYRVFSNTQGKYYDLFYNKWEKYYGDLKKFAITNSLEINETNRKETSDYLVAFDKIDDVDNIPSIGNAIYTLLDNIPKEVEKILDLGAGTGYVEERIPNYYQVLAMDIDEKILRQNPRPSCLGDALQIPLKDKSVDMTITCDVLEHISVEKLEQAVKEMKRVTKKYIYIQVPYRENLLAGMAFCPHCKEEWHVNHHKNSFIPEQIVDLVGKEWKAVRVNYTGEVSYLSNQSQIFCLLKENGIHCNNIKGWKCPKCGSLSELRDDRVLHSLENLLGQREEEFPHYSEMGILFAHEDIPVLKKEKKEPCYKVETMDQCKMDFHYDYCVKEGFSLLENRPSIFTQCSYYRREKECITFERNQGESKGYIGFSFPVTFQKNDIIKIIGKTFEETKIMVCTGTMNGSEILLYEGSPVKGDFNCIIPIDKKLVENKAIIKVYFYSFIIQMKYVEIKRKEKLPYKRLFFSDSDKMFYLLKNNQVYSFFKENVEYMDMSMGFINMKKPGNKKIDLKNIILKSNELIDELQKMDMGKSVTLSEELNGFDINDINDNVNIEKTNKLNELLLSQMESILNENEDLKQRNNSLGELIMSIQLEGRKGSGREKLINNIRKILDKCILFFMKIPFLYELFVRLGGKKIYAKIKNMRKG